MRFVRARAHLRALMTQKTCAVGMRNAKLGIHLKEGVIVNFGHYFCYIQLIESITMVIIISVVICEFSGEDLK